MQNSPSIMSTDEFVEELFGNADGFVYAPYRFGRWYQLFFHWPSEKVQLLEHLHDYKDKELFISPSLFTQKAITPSNFKGTNFIWTEFDGNAPDAGNVELPPSIRIKSSYHGREHWYWRLNEFITDANLAQDITKRLAYHLQADLSVWDYACVLRPPETRNHKRQMPVVALETNDLTYNTSSFNSIPEAPNRIDISISTSNLPELQGLLAKYAWTKDAYELLRKAIPQGKRSEALARLCFECAEMGMSNEEIYVVIEDAAARWKKFHKRTDREKRLVGLISYTRGKKAEQAEFTDTQTVVYRFKDFLATSINLKWIITDLLPVAGSAVLFGPSSVGKSTFALRMGIAIATGAKSFLDWPIERKQKVLFTSLEMPHDELKFFISQMNLSNEELEGLQENFFIWPLGHPYPFDTKDQQIEILKYIDQFGIEFNIIDSMGEAAYGSISNSDDMKRLYSFMNEDLRKDRGCGYLFIHHPRKPGSNEQKVPQDYNDAYGDTYIINRAQTVINLNPVSANRLKVNIFKSRLSMDQQSFHVLRRPDRSFERVRAENRKAAANKERHDELLRDSPNILSFGSRHRE